jgi:hypothetical protein
MRSRLEEPKLGAIFTPLDLNSVFGMKLTLRRAVFMSVISLDSGPHGLPSDSCVGPE